MYIYYTKKKISNTLQSKLNIDKLIFEPQGTFNKLYLLAENLDKVTCFIYDNSSFIGLPKQEIRNFFTLLSKNNIIILQLQ